MLTNQGETTGDVTSPHGAAVKPKQRSPNIRQHQPLKRTTAVEAHKTKNILNKSFDSNGLLGYQTPARVKGNQDSKSGKKSGSGEKKSFVNLMKSKFTKSTSALKTSQKKSSDDK